MLFESPESTAAPTILRPEVITGPEAGPGPQGVIQRDGRLSEEAQRAVVGLAFSGDCSLLVVVDGDKTVRVWELSSKQCIGTHRFGKKLTCVAIAPISEGSATEAVLVADKV
jgi:WD40 repeat protein